MCKTSMPSCKRACVYVDSFVIDGKECHACFPHVHRIYNLVISILGAEPVSVRVVIGTVLFFVLFIGDALIKGRIGC